MAVDGALDMKREESSSISSPHVHKVSSMSTNTLEEIFHPQSIAVVGASDNPSARGYARTAPLLKHGYQGKIYLVNPKYSEILGIKAYASIRDIPGPVDYVISCVPAPEVLGMLADCSQKGVKTVHLYTARLSETGRREAIELEQKILTEARNQGIRLIGPNCMGIYYPRQGMAFNDALPKESGSVGLVSQSGQAAEELARLASLRGVYFSKAISYGNALDLNECDFLDYLSQDAETKIILMYVEGVKDGKRFFNTLRRAAATKPVIIIKGGRGKSGTRAAASHTASLAGSMNIWEATVTQAGAIPAEDLDELIDLTVSFYFLPSIKGSRVGVVAEGGGSSVLAADQCEEAGLDVIALPTEIREELKSKGIPAWDWIGNPADMSIMLGIDFGVDDMLEIMAGNQNFDLLIAMMEHRYRGRLKPKGNELKPLLAVMRERSLGSDDYNSWKLMRQMRKKFIAANIPFYPTIRRAARSARKLIDYYQKRG